MHPVSLAKKISRPAAWRILLALALLPSCNEGLAPRGESFQITGISGKVFFQNWPSADSLVDLRIVAFKRFQRHFTPTDIFVQILGDPPEAFAFPGLADTIPLPRNVDELDYQLELPPGRYEYIVFAQQYGPNILMDWQAAGQYDTDTDSLPSALTVQEGQLTRNIFIFVDFKHLPLQPF